MVTEIETFAAAWMTSRKPLMRLKSIRIADTRIRFGAP